MKLQVGPRTLAAAVAVMALFLGACDGNPLVSPANPIVQGIVEWVDAPPNAAGGGENESLRARIELPDSIVAGESFNARFVTLRPSLCWFSDSVGVQEEGRQLELTMWVRGPRPGQICPLAMSELSRRLTLSFPEPGEHTIVLVGRRVAGSTPAHDPFTGEEGRIEVVVQVHPPSSSQ